jgi:hypothetical protein
VDQLDNDGEIEMPGGHSAAGSATQQRHQGPEAFAAAADGVGDVTFHGRVERGGLLRDPRFHFLELGPNS